MLAQQVQSPASTPQQHVNWACLSRQKGQTFQVIRGNRVNMRPDWGFLKLKLPPFVLSLRVMDVFAQSKYSYTA